jgi:hypothetical protein
MFGTLGASPLTRNPLREFRPLPAKERGEVKSAYAATAFFAVGTDAIVFRICDAIW